MEPAKMSLTPDQLVAREVHYCVSALVSTLSGGAYGHVTDGTELAALTEQAFDLRSPVLDYEEPLLEAGWTHDTAGWHHPEDLGPGEPDAQRACAEAELEPYEWEVFEHWIVSDWLADKLEAQGEKVDRDFAGMTVWARTTSGQGIASDGVIERICAELNAAV